jgi:hypothetical protein
MYSDVCYPAVWVDWWSTANSEHPLNNENGMYLGVYAALGVGATAFLTVSCWYADSIDVRGLISADRPGCYSSRSFRTQPSTSMTSFSTLSWRKFSQPIVVAYQLSDCVSQSTLAILP